MLRSNAAVGDMSSNFRFDPDRQQRHCVPLSPAGQAARLVF